MKLLIYGINYAPELTGIGKYTGEMAEWLANQGHQVEVITAMPYYPEWKITKKYRTKWWHTEYRNRVKVNRSPFYVPQQVTGKTRILHEFSFLLSTQFFWVKSLFKRYDCVLSISPPFHTGFSALLFSLFKRIPVIYHIQDLQVDAAKDLNLIKNSSVLNLLFRLEKMILQRSTIVSTISEGMFKRLVTKGISKEKMLFFPNWVDTTFIKPLPKKDSLRSEWGFSQVDKIVLYSGNLGEKQGLEIIIETADQLKTKKKLHFIIVGEGGKKEALIALTKVKQLNNVHFYPLQPYEKLSTLLATADLHLVLQKKAAADLVMPSKLTSILAVGGVAIVTSEPESTLYEIVTKHQLGILIEPGNAQALTTGILKGIEIDLSEYKENARKYAQKHLSKENILKQFETDLESIVLNKKLKYRKANTL